MLWTLLWLRTLFESERTTKGKPSWRVRCICDVEKYVKMTWVNAMKQRMDAKVRCTHRWISRARTRYGRETERERDARKRWCPMHAFVEVKWQIPSSLQATRAESRLTVYRAHWLRCRERILRLHEPPARKSDWRFTACFDVSWPEGIVFCFSENF